MKPLNLNHERLEQCVTSRAFADLNEQIKHLKQTNPTHEQYAEQLQLLTRTLVQTLNLCGFKDLKEKHLDVVLLSELMSLHHHNEEWSRLSPIWLRGERD